MRFFLPILTAFFVVHSLGYAEPKPPRNLRESIDLCLKLNPRTLSKDYQVIAQDHLALMARDQMLPRASLGCEYSSDYSNIKIENNKVRSKSRTTSSSCDLSVNMTLWDGGVNYNNYKAAQAQAQATKFRFNTTNNLIENAKGTLVARTVHNYRSILMSKNIVMSTQKLRHQLMRLSKMVKTENDRIRWNQARDTLQQKESEMTNLLRSSISDFRYIVGVKPDDNLADFEEVLSEIQIPQTPEEAYRIALEKSNDIKATDFELKASEYNYKSARAALGPSVVVVGTVSKETTRDEILSLNDSVWESSSLMVRAQIPLDISNYHYLKAQESLLKAAQLERDAALDDARQELEESYENFLGQLELVEQTQKALNNSEKDLEKTLKDIDDHLHDNDRAVVPNTVNQITSVLSTAIDLNQQKSHLMRHKFSIQQTMGTVF